MADETKKPYASIRIVNKFGTLQVLDARGRDISGVFGVDMALRPGRPPLMRLNLNAGPVEIDGVPVFGVWDPVTHKIRAVKRIEWLDGGEPFETPEQPEPGPVVPAGSVEISAEEADRIRQAASDNRKSSEKSSEELEREAQDRAWSHGE